MTTEATSPVNAETDGEESESASQASEDRYIRINPDDLHGEVARLLQERPDFKQAVGTVMGSRQKRQADARIRELEAQLDSMTLAEKRRHFQSMDEDERAQALSDPNVAADYAETMRRKVPDANQVRAASSVDIAVEDALDELRRIGAPEARIATWQQYIRDQSSPFDRSSATAFVQSIQRAVDMEVHTPAADRFEKYGYGKAPARPEPEPEDEEQPESTPTVAANPRLARGATDMSPADGGGKRRKYQTQLQVATALQNHEPGVTPETYRLAKLNLPYS